MENYRRGNGLKGLCTISSCVGLLGLLGSIVAMEGERNFSQSMDSLPKIQREQNRDLKAYKTMARITYGLVMTSGLGLMILNYRDERRGY